MDPDNVDALCDRAELYVSQQMYEEAIKDYQKAKDVENHPQKVHESSRSLSSTNPRRNHPSALSGTLTPIGKQNAEPLRCLALRARTGRLGCIPLWAYQAAASLGINF